MVKSRIYPMYNGSNYVVSSDLAYTDILLVKRGGLNFDNSDGATPASREYKFTTGAGKIEFLDPFEDVNGSRTQYEPIFVLFND